MTGSVEVALDGVRLALDPGAGPCRIVLDGDRIAEVRPSTVDRGLLAAPGYIDLQVNGAVGVDLATEPERLDEVARALPRFGVTAFAPTAITCSPEATRRALAAAAPHDADTSGGATHLGWHLEGPFLSPARVGAHSLRHIRPPDAAEVETWLDGRAAPRLVTIAPELAGAAEVIDALVSSGVVVAAGHSDATAEELATAGRHGVTLVTHLGNATGGLAARDPGIVGAALDPRWTGFASLILDGLHLHDVTARTFLAALGDRAVVVSDCIAATGLGDGDHHLGDRRVVVRDGVARTTDGVLAGSTMPLGVAIHRAVAAGVCSLRAAVAAATVAPARLLGEAERGRIVPGARADIVLLDDTGRLVETIIAGRSANSG